MRAYPKTSQPTYPVRRRLTDMSDLVIPLLNHHQVFSQVADSLYLYLFSISHEVTRHGL
jgi:hypothetical protein